MKEAILKALEQLDPANDEHWTKEGLPSVEAVQKAADDATLTRAMITDNANGYTREVAKEIAEQKAVERAGKQAQIDGADDVFGDEQSDTTIQAKPEEKPEEKAPMLQPKSPSEHKAELEANVKMASERLQAHDLAMDKARQKRDELARLEAVAKRELNNAFPPKKPQEVVQHWLKSQAEARKARGGVVAAGPKSQLDRAMARRTGYGGARPRVPLIG